MHYVIGEVHGEPAKLDTVLQKLDPRPGDTVIFLGDYVGYGPDSLGVIRRIMNLPSELGVKVVPLRGDHEDILHRALIYPIVDVSIPFAYGGGPVSYWEIFKAMGGAETIKALALLDSPEAKKIAGFIQTLPFTWNGIVDEMRVLAVHAGVMPTHTDILNQTLSDLVRVKGWQALYSMRARSGLPVPWDLIIHGHDDTDIPGQVFRGMVNLNAGAGVDPNGRVVGYVIESGERFFG